MQQHPDGAIVVASPEPMPPVTRWHAVWHWTALVSFVAAGVLAFGVIVLGATDVDRAGTLRWAAGVLFGLAGVAALASRYVLARHDALVTAAIDRESYEDDGAGYDDDEAGDPR